jgi:hypothetical protein
MVMTPPWSNPDQPAAAQRPPRKRAAANKVAPAAPPRTPAPKKNAAPTPPPPAAPKTRIRAAKKAAPAARPPDEAPTPAPPAVADVGPVELAARTELRALALDQTTLAASVFMSARHADRADSAAGAAAALREMRMTLSALKAAGSSLPAPGEKQGEQPTNVTPPNRLQALRERKAGGASG